MSETPPIRKIEKLPVQTYTPLKDRLQPHVRSWGYVGQEASVLGTIDPNDKTDMTRLKQIEKALPKDYFSSDPSDKGLFRWIRQRNTDRVQESSGFVIGVRGGDRVAGMDVAHGQLGKLERGELQGWVNIYEDEYDAVKQLRKEGKLDPAEKGTKQRILEVSYAKHPDSPDHQMANGLRQACLEISRVDAQLGAYEDKEAAEKLEKRLAKNKKNGSWSLETEIKLREELELRNSKPRTLVTAYVDPKNVAASVPVLEATGFDNMGLMEIKDAEGDKDKQHVFVLNWDKLHTIVQGRADQTVQPSATIK